ncbi:MAG: methionine gamma-lyase family protein [Firmicutes bacterium]|nr:methionine gamma-lyase family protein [Bacillota bacterium]
MIDIICDDLLRLADEVERKLEKRFQEVDIISKENTARVLNAFHTERVSDSMFAGVTGYGYDDPGREALDKIYAGIFGAEAALVRLQFVSGTHAIAAALFAALRPGQILLSVTGAPYDTLRSVIGIQGGAPGTLKSYGVGYAQIELGSDGGADLDAIAAAPWEDVGAVLIQRSRGYAARRALTVAEIGALAARIRAVNPRINIVVDNCYGEFTETSEPASAGVDLCAGSLIKNPGGGLAPAGGYVCGRADLVEAAACRLTAPGIGQKCGATLGQNRLLFQGLFLAPHTTAQALKTAIFAAGMLEALGYRTSPSALEPRSDIIQAVELGSAEKLAAFCRGIQRGAPVDAFVTPEPWRMPGYDCDVIMAAGAFIQGASIELSADGPMREPFRAYLQGGLTYESGRLGILTAIAGMEEEETAHP